MATTVCEQNKNVVPYVFVVVLKNALRREIRPYLTPLFSGFSLPNFDRSLQVESDTSVLSDISVRNTQTDPGR